MQKLRLAKDLREDLAILKLKKGNVIVLINKSDSYQSLEGLFSDKSKFRLIDEDPTLTHLSPLQKYLRILFNCGKINEDQVKKLRPQNAIVALAYALPKIYKNFTRFPPFRAIFDTTSPCYYDAGSLLTDLLTPITHSDFFQKIHLMLQPKFVKFHHCCLIMVIFLQHLMWRSYSKMCHSTERLMSFWIGYIMRILI